MKFLNRFNINTKNAKQIQKRYFQFDISNKTEIKNINVLGKIY